MKLRPVSEAPNCGSLLHPDPIYLFTEDGDLIKGIFREREPRSKDTYETWNGHHEAGRGLTTLPKPENADPYPNRPAVVGWIPVEEVREFFSLEFIDDHE